MKNGEGEIEMSVGVVVKKCGVMVRKMGECENVENRWKCGAKVIDCELFELFYGVLNERI